MKLPPEPVAIIYHVKPGAEKQLRDLLQLAWKIYQKERMVYDQPHVCVQVKEDSEHVRFIEIFTWASYFATEHPPDSVNAIMRQIRSLCEERGGNLGIEVRSAKMLSPVVREHGSSNSNRGGR